MLNSPAFRPLPLGSIHPEGWLARQLRIQADGIHGHLDEFWPDVKDSRWFGGQAEGWERAPYWLDGLVPLAYLLDDAMLKEKARRYVEYILDHQEEDGWLGPRAMAGPGGRVVTAQYDIWGLFLVLKVLVQYGEATGDERAAAAVEKCLHMIDLHIDTAPLFNWGQFRWFEALLPIYWLYELSGENWLLELAVKLQAQGFGWPEFFRRWPLAAPTPRGRWNFAGHVVNNAMALKAPALWWRLTGDEADQDAVYDIMNKLDRYHGMVTGVFTGDECLAGRSPTQGTELCAVVEQAFSLEVLLSLLGDPALADRLEQVIFNALPATFSPDMWAHQYDQQANQVQCSEGSAWPWNSNGPESNLFGVEPNYGCCTANLGQGWPKFAASLWLRNGDGEEDSLTAAAYAPSRVELEIGGVKVVARLETDYPFRETLRFTITVERPVRFPLYLRIPGWCRDAKVQVGGEAPVDGHAGGFHHSLERTWEGTTEVLLTLPMPAELVRGQRGALALKRGPLVYALKIGEDWRRVHTDAPFRDLPHADWEVYPTTPWNYALDVNEYTLGRDVRFAEHPLGDTPFSPAGAPVSATVRGRRLPDWEMANNWAGDVPAGPMTVTSTSEEPLEELTLIPYGCTNLRVTEFPVLARK
jgi:hypothetical protein